MGKDELSAKRIKDQAEKEVRREREEEAIEKLKDLYRQKAKAEQAVKNIEREIEDTLHEIELNA